MDRQDERSRPSSRLTDEYLKRLSRYADVEGVALKDEAALLKLCGRDARPARHTLVLLGWAGEAAIVGGIGQISRRLSGSKSTCRFFSAVGPADGFSDQARQTATLILSLGKMTLAARVGAGGAAGATLPGLHHSKGSPLSPGTLKAAGIQACTFVMFRSGLDESRV